MTSIAEVNTTLDSTEIIDASGIAARYGISRPSVSNWQKRTDFPEPLPTPLCRGSKIWDVNVVDEWMAERTHVVTTSVRTLKETARG